MRYLTLLLPLLLLGCDHDPAPAVTTGPFTIGTEVSQKDKLLLYPISATAEFVSAQAAVAEYQTLIHSFQAAATA